MRTYTSLAAWLFLLAATPNVRGQAGVIPPGEANPVLRVQAGGPTSLVNALAFSADGRTLYTSGWDKVVHVWRLDAKDEWWRAAPAYRVPLGPGADGKINAVALSADGNWLAVAGSGAVRSRAGFREVGIVVPSLVMSTAMREDQGIIYVFDVNTRVARVLRGHRGPVFALTFAPPAPGAPKDEPPPLVSAARERQDQSGDYAGAVWVWDTGKGTHQAWPAPLPDVGLMSRPGLASWRSADGPKGLHVAVAWEDGIFRTWDVARGKDGLAEQKDATRNVVVAAVPGQQTPARLLTGGLRSPRGYLQEWKVPAAGGLQPVSLLPDANKDLAPGTAYVPLALTLVSAQPGAPPDHAAVAVYVQKDKQRQLRLHLLDLDPARFGALKADIPLWQHFGSMPTLAAAPGGRYLAVSDPEDQEGHGILVYVIQDLLTKKAKAQPWRLSGVGDTLRYVSFVRGKKGLGLLLSEQAKNKAGTPPRLEARPGDLFFDFNKPGFTARGGWLVDAPDLANWRIDRQVAEVGKQKQTTFTITGGGFSRKISIEGGQRVTEFALLPPAGANKSALLAVAVEKFGEPSLLVYDAGSGGLLRQFTGHDDFIRGLAFSADGKLLASAAEDQTVCLWSLTDLPQILGKHGLLTGLAVKDGAKGTVTVGRVDQGSAAAGKLAPGDVIEGLIVDGKLKPAPSASNFYTALWERKPGQTITLQVTGKGRVALPVEQAVDERHPLLTLFITRGTKAGARDWIAWNPQGPYEDSGPRAETHLGWHINTGKPDAPTSFARAGEYRAKYYKEGLLGHLVARAGLAPALEDLKKEEEARLPPDPRVLVRIGDEFLEATRADDKGIIAVQPRQLVLGVKVDDFPLDKIGGVELGVDGQGLQKIEPSSASEWSAELPPWQSGEHTVRVLVRTPGGRRPDYTVGPLKVRYQPPPPTLTTDLPRRQVVKSPGFTVRAVTSAEIPGQDVNVTLKLNKTVVPGAGGPGINKRVDLRRGDNLIEIEAVNKNALPGFEKAETARLVMEVIYDPQAPQIVLNEIVPLLSGKEDGTAVAITPGEPVIVNVPKFRVRGTIAAQEDLTAALLDGRQLAGFTAGKKAGTIDQMISLAKAGPQHVTFTVKTKNTEATRTLEVEYRPQLGSIVFLPQPGGLVFFDEGKGAPEVALRFQMNPPRDPAPIKQEIQATVLVNGERLAAPQAVDPKAKELMVKFKPQVRDNSIQVRLSAPWAEPQTSEGIAVQYLRVPFGIEFVNPPPASETPEIDITARIKSALPLRPQDIRATVMDRPIQNVTVEKQAGQTWFVRLKNISLDGIKGSKSNLRLDARNVDGKCRAPAECSVIYRGPPPKRADVVILAPLNAKVTDPAVTVQFRVKSESRLQQLTLVHDETHMAQVLDVSRLPDGPADLKIALGLASRGDKKPLNLAALKANAQGFLEGDGDLTLVPGLNPLRVTARNEAGEQSQTVVVSFLPPPVRVLVEKLEPLEGGAAVGVRALADGRLSPEAPQGRLLLHGRVVLSKEGDERLKGVERLILRVNGVQQVDPVKLDLPAAGKPRERSFQVKVFLSQPKDNRLEIDVPGLPVEDGDQRVYLASCVKPVPEKRMLHLLIIGISEKNGSRLKDRVLTALGATSIRGREFNLASFDQGLVYGPLVDNVRPVGQTDVFLQFLMVKKTMDALARKDWFTHVVMVYYQGNEVVNDKGYFLRTSGPELDPSLQFYRIPGDTLKKLLTDSRGVKILLMDVARETSTKEPAADVERQAEIQLFADSNAAVMRYAQLGRGRPQDQPSLIGALEASLHRASRLRPVSQLVAQQLEELFKSNSASFRSRIPDPVEDVAIGPDQKQ